MKLILEGHRDELPAKAADLVKALANVLAPTSPDLADALVKATIPKVAPPEYTELDFAAMRTLQKRLQADYLEASRDMLAEIMGVLDVAEKSEEPSDETTDPDDNDLDEPVDGGEDQDEGDQELLAALYEFEQDELIKGAGHKYIRRIPTGNPKRPWKYIYRETQTGQLNRDAVVGEKVRIKEGDKQGHYEVMEDLGNGWIRLKHDETGTEMSARQEHLQQLFLAEYKEVHRDQRMALEKRYAKARESGKKGIIAKAREALERHKKEFPSPEARNAQLQARDATTMAMKVNTPAAHKLAAMAHIMAIDEGAANSALHKKIAAVHETRATDLAKKITPKKKRKKTPLEFGTKQKAYDDMIHEVFSGNPPEDLTGNDAAYWRWVKGGKGRGDKPKHTAATFDAVDEELNIERDRRSKRYKANAKVTSLAEAWDRLTAGVRRWDDPRVVRALQVLRSLPEAERMDMPEGVMNTLLAKEIKARRESGMTWEAEQYADHLHHKKMKLEVSVNRRLDQVDKGELSLEERKQLGEDMKELKRLQEEYDKFVAEASGEIPTPTPDPDQPEDVPF